MKAIQENQLIFMMNQFAKTKKEIVKAEYTIVLFNVYEDNQLEKLHIKQNMSLKILDPQLNIQLIEQVISRKTTTTTYNLSPEALKSSQIKRDIFKVQKTYETTAEENKNIIINIAEVNGKLVRLVMIPIEKKLMSLGQVAELTKQLKEQQENFHKQQKDLNGQKKNQMKQIFKKKQSQLRKQIIDKMRIKQLKIYNIQSILSFLMEKTEKVSFLGILDMEILKEQQKQILRITQELKTLVYISEDSKIQFLKYNVQLKDVEKNQHNAVSSILVIDDSQMKNKSDSPVLGIHKMNALDDKNFMPAANIQLKIYNQMQNKQQNNEFLSAAIEEFTKTWDNVVYLSSTPVATIVKAIYGNLSLSTSFSKTFISSQTKLEESSIRESLEILTYDEVFERFKIKQDLQLTENVKIQKYLTPQRLKRGDKQIQIHKDERLVPLTIQKLVFLHYFYMMNKAFLANYQEKQKQGYQVLLDYVSNYVVKVCELANDINDSYLLEYQDVRCTNSQMYFNFLSFLFKSLKHMKKVTNRQFSICGVLKALFQNLQPKENVLLEYVIKNQGIIEIHESIRYYDLYLQIIKENGQKVENELQYIYLKIHKLKADRIASQFIDIKAKVVQAVRSYCQIIYKFDAIPENKRESIDKFQIQKRIARLLIVLGRMEEALLVFKKNHMIASVEKTFKFMLKQYSGNKRAEQCLSIAKYFEKQSAYDKAIDYCRIAYEAAKDSSMRRKAKQSQLAFVDSYMQKRLQEKKPLARYGKNTCTEQQFNSWENMSPQDQKGKQLFKNLRNNLSWDKQKQQSQILAGEDNDQSLMM